MSENKFETRLFINGEFVEASDKGTFAIHNPATQEKIIDVSEATDEDVNAAVAAAKAAFPKWSAMKPQDRGECLKKLASLIREHNEELAYLEAISMGRPISQYIDGYAAAESLDHYAQAWHTILGATSLNTPGFVNMTFRQPYGVAAVIIPWNVPLLFFAAKAAPALIAGNTVVLKSSEKAPLTSAKVATLIEKAGFPPGVFNILSGHGLPSGSALSHHKDVRVLSFTGSGRTGRLIQEAAAKSNLKKVILELGGKSPAIIFADANLDKAVLETRYSAQWNSGQVCMSNSRIYVEKSIASKFIETFKEKFAAVAAGDPTSKNIDHGPQVDKVQYDNVMRYIEEAKKDGSLVLGGKGNLESTKGYFVDPTIFVDTPEKARPMREEIFGPVVHINEFETEEEVVSKANDTEYGLYAAVYTKNIDRALRVAKALEAGTVGINCTSPTGARDLPFGGYKASGQGREGWSVSMDNYLETKTVLVKLDE